MKVHPSQPFQFKDFADFQSKSTHLNTNDLLRQGHMNVGGSRYKVTLSTNNTISVSREQSANKAGRFFSGMSDMFNHRMADESTSSRSSRMSEQLTYRRDVEVRAATIKAKNKPSSTSHTTHPHRKGHVSSHHQHSVSNPADKKLTFNDFMKQEKDRADYHGEAPSQHLAQQAYSRYMQENKPAEAPPIRHTKSDPLPMQSKPQSAKQTLDHFIQQEVNRADYHGESPNLANAHQAYNDHIFEQQPPLRKQSTSSHSQNASTQHLSTRPKPNKSEPYNHFTDMERIKSELDTASYYGTSPNVSPLEQSMYQAEISRHQSPARTASQATGPQKASRPTTTAQATRTSKKPTQNAQRQSLTLKQLSQNITIDIRALPLSEQTQPLRTMAKINRLGIKDETKMQALDLMNDYMSQPTKQREKNMISLQNLLDNAAKRK